MTQYTTDKDLLNEKLKKATEQENASKKKIIMLDREIERIREQKVKPFQNQTASKHTRQIGKNPICTFETYVCKSFITQLSYCGFHKLLSR
jgi:hypothetical protein